MKTALLIICSFLTISASSQTYNLETENMTRRYTSGEFSSEDYKMYGKDWAELIKSMNGYPSLPYNEETKEIDFKWIKSFDKLEKKTIYDRIMEWSAVSFGSLSSVLNYSNLENGKILMKGWFEVYYKIDIQTFFSSKKESANSVKCFFTYVFTIKDNKLKVEVIDINYKYYIPYNMIGSTYVPSYEIDRSIKSFYPITSSASIEWKGRLDLLYETNNKLNQFINNLEKYIKNKSTDYNF
ncbi:MAG: DUF4468 domain-containing protein [Bacteroidales bacterium]